MKWFVGIGVGLFLAGAAFAGPSPELPSGPFHSDGLFGTQVQHDDLMYPFRSNSHRKKTRKQDTPAASGNAPCQPSPVTSVSTKGKKDRAHRAKPQLGQKHGFGSWGKSKNATSAGLEGT